MGVPEGENLPALDYHQLLFNYLRLLGFDSTTMTVKHRMKFDRDTFKFPNPKAFYHVVHFLFYQLDKPQAVETFRDVWPIIDKKQEAQFRKRVQQWLTQIQETNKDFQYAHINLAIFMSPGGDKFVQLMCALACHIMQRRHPCGPSVAPPAASSKSALVNQFRFQMIKGNLLVALQNWARLTADFQQQYQQEKQLANQMIVRYRELCQKNARARAKLRDAVEASSLSDAHKKALLEGNASSACRDLVTDVEAKQKELSDLLGRMFEHERPLSDAAGVVDSVIHLKRSRPCFDGKQVVAQMAPQFIERYQNEHSGTHLELQYEEGRLHFLPLMNLLLFALKTAARGSAQLNFPPLDDQLRQLQQRQQLVADAAADVNQLGHRWNRIVEDQTAVIQQHFACKVQAVPMSLQTVTPFRSLLAKKNSNGGAAAETPSALRAALGLTPAELGATTAASTAADKKKLRARLSHEQPLKSRLLVAAAAEEKAPPKRTPDAVTRLSHALAHHRTPKNANGSRFSLGNGTSPFLERPDRFSLDVCSPSVAHKKNGGVAAARVGLKTASTPVTTPVTSKRPAAANGAANGIASVPNAVLERAADAIVFDLVRLDSPLVGATTDLHSANFFDPNSSFEKTAFQSRNLIGRSPEAAAGANADLLKILETSLGATRRSSLRPVAAAAAAVATPGPPSAPDASVGSLDLEHFDKEKGLLDASGASLIDGLLDFSLL